MLIFNNNLSTSSRRPTFSWKCDCFTVSFQSRESSSAAVVPPRRQVSCPSCRQKRQAAAGESCAPTITTPFFFQMGEVCRVTIWQMPKLLCKQMGINEKQPALPVLLATDLLHEESLPANAPKRGKKIRAMQHPEASSCKWHFVLIQPNNANRISTMGWDTLLKSKVQFWW